MRSYAVTHPGGEVRLPQHDEWDQLIYAVRGVVRLRTDEGLWVLPPLRAGWVPAGTAHTCRLTQPTSMRTLYVARGLLPGPGVTTVLDVTPLARELVLHLVRSAPCFDGPLVAAQLTVLADVLRGAGQAPLQLPWPVSGPCRRVAERLSAAPGERTGVDELARAAGVGRRSLERSFRRETSMSIGAWRQRLRLVAGLERLAAGIPVGTVAAELGYTQSAFGLLFREQLGVSPGRWAAEAMTENG